MHHHHGVFWKKINLRSGSQGKEEWTKLNLHAQCFRGVILKKNMRQVMGSAILCKMWTGMIFQPARVVVMSFFNNKPIDIIFELIKKSPSCLFN